MNLNPFVYEYKVYPNSSLATKVNKFCGALQRIFFIFGVLIVITAFTVINPGEAILCAVVMFLLWLLFKFRKDKWSDRIAEKQENVDNNTEND